MKPIRFRAKMFDSLVSENAATRMWDAYMRELALQPSRMMSGNKGLLSNGVTPKRTSDMSVSKSDMRALLDSFKELKEQEERRDRKTKDALLTCPTEAELQAYMKTTARVDSGRVWSGLESALDAMEPSGREKLYSQMDAYRARDKRKTGDSDGRFMGRTARDMATGIAAINAAGRAFWDKPNR